MVEAAELLGLLREWGYVLVFLAGMLEAMPFLGMLVPGQGVIILAGVLAAQGVLDVRTVILAAIAAGILGDAIGYYLGRWRGRWILLRFGPRFRLEEKHVHRADALFERYGPVALVLARFSFLTRGLASLLAGTHRMKQGVFWPLNVGGAIVWGVGYALLGFVFGGSIEVLEGVLGPTIAFTLVALLLLFVLSKGLRKVSPEFTVEDAALAVLAGACGVLFAFLAEPERLPAPQPVIDAARGALAVALVEWAPLAFWRVVTFLGSSTVILPLALGAVIGFAVRRQWWDVLLFALGPAGERILTGLLKVAFARPRPEDAFVAVQTFAFPSGHAAQTVVFAGAVVYVLSRRFADGWRQGVLVGVGVLYVVLVGLSRVALREHYPSDVLGGWLLGAAWLFTVLLLVEAWFKWARSRERARAAAQRVGASGE